MHVIKVFFKDIYIFKSLCFVKRFNRCERTHSRNIAQASCYRWWCYYVIISLWSYSKWVLVFSTHQQDYRVYEYLFYVWAIGRRGDTCILFCWYLSVCLLVGRPYGFSWLSWKPFIPKSSYFTCRLLMTSRCIDFGITRSKVKVTVTFHVNFFAAHFLENY